jgi:hypothetical protein
MKNPGEKVEKGESMVSIIQKGKKLNLYSPITGTIKAKNEQLDSDSSIINSSPYSEGWVYMIEPVNWLKENQLMMMAEKASDWIKNEFTRIKEFLANSVNVNNTGLAYAALQDGGELKDGVLSDLGPEVWEEFQTRFIDVVK